MNRRSFIQTTGLGPLLPMLPSVRELRVKLTPTNSTTLPVRMIVTAHVSSKKAEQYRRGWTQRPYETFGEFDVNSREPRSLPPEFAQMPGALTYFTAIVGVAAQRQIYLIGAFRRDNITVVARIDTSDETQMLAVAEHILLQQIPDPFATIWNESSLRRFLPDESILGEFLEQPDNSWP